MMTLFMSRESLIAKIDNIVEERGIWDDKAQKLMTTLARRDGVHFNGHWYYGALKSGESTRAGYRAAIHEGGFEAGQSYIKIMGKAD